jgi:hypothetical protein
VNLYDNPIRFRGTARIIGITNESNELNYLLNVNCFVSLRLKVRRKSKQAVEKQLNRGEKNQ